MTLLDVCEAIVDCPHSTAKDEGVGYPLIRTPNVGKGRLLLDGVHRVCQEVYDKRNERAIPQENDLILAREAPVGNVAIIKRGQKVCLGQRTVLIRPDQRVVDPDYLTYYLLSPQMQHALISSSNGATVSHLNMSSIRKLEVQLPPVEDQKRASKILTKIDDQIELNTIMNNTLMEQAMTLFDAMFPNIVSGNHTVGEYIIPKRGKGLLSKDAMPGDIPVVAGGLEPSTFHNESNTKAPVLTISASGANAGYVNIWQRPVWSSDSSFIDSNMTQHVYFWYVMLKKRQQEIYNSQTGSAQPHVYPQHIANLPLAELDMEAVSDFSRKVTTLFSLVGHNLIENEKLSKSKEALLPCLISGKIDVSRIQIEP